MFSSPKFIQIIIFVLLRNWKLDDVLIYGIGVYYSFAIVGLSSEVIFKKNCQFVIIYWLIEKKVSPLPCLLWYSIFINLIINVWDGNSNRAEILIIIFTYLVSKKFELVRITIINSAILAAANDSSPFDFMIKIVIRPY